VAVFLVLVFWVREADDKREICVRRSKGCCEITSHVVQVLGKRLALQDVFNLLEWYLQVVYQSSMWNLSLFDSSRSPPVSSGVGDALLKHLFQRYTPKQSLHI